MQKVTFSTKRFFCLFYQGIMTLPANGISDRTPDKCHSGMNILEYVWDNSENMPVNADYFQNKMKQIHVLG